MRTLDDLDKKDKGQPKSSMRDNEFEIDGDLETVSQEDINSLINNIEKEQKSKKNKYEDDLDFGGSSSGSLKAIVSVIIVIIIVAIIFVFIKGKDVDNPTSGGSNLDTISANLQNDNKDNYNSIDIQNSDDDSIEDISGGTLMMQDEEGNMIQIDSNSDDGDRSNIGTDVGLPDFEKNNGNTASSKENSSSVKDYSKFVDSFSGKEESVNYTVNKIENSTDFVNYTKYRTVTGTGTELYWLDAIYKDRPYIITVSYKIFRTLDESGIIPVDVETVVLKDGEKIVTSISVKTDYTN